MLRRLRASAAPAARALAGAAALLPAGAPPTDDARVQQYLGLARATLAQPIAPAELAGALLSPSTVEDVARMFEESLEAGVVVDGARVTPELGGEATLDDGAIRFAVYPDPLHAVVRRMLAVRDRPEALLTVLSQSAEGRQVLHTTGGLHALLHQMTTRPPAEPQWRALDRVLQAAVATHFKTWNVTPETQRAAIARHDWRGRYVGFWHLHPPRIGRSGYEAGLEPSYEDAAIAGEKGQMLTLVFQPDGFDAYDLSPLAGAGAPDLSKARVIRHRSPGWAGRFRVRESPSAQPRGGG